MTKLEALAKACKDKRIAELEEKLANADYQLEGRDLEIKELEKENAELKELIKNIIRVTWGEGWNYSLDWKVKAEQFINSEVEK